MLPIEKAEAANLKSFEYFVPDKIDLRTLAWAYLDEFIRLDIHTFTTGYYEKQHLRFQRFEAVAKLLGEDERRRIIDAMDLHQALHRGDTWQVYKYCCEPGFWSKIVDKSTVLRIANKELGEDFDDELYSDTSRYIDTLRTVQLDFLNFTDLCI